MKTIALAAVLAASTFHVHGTAVLAPDADARAESTAWQEAFFRCGGSLPILVEGVHSRDEKVEARYDADFKCDGGAPELADRLHTAPWVVDGVVTAIGDVKGFRGSEHDPMWRIATIQVGEVYQGNAKSGGTITLAFASSDDVAWFGAPKLLVGQRGIFIAQPMPGAEGSAAVLAPVDVQPMAARNVVFRLTHPIVH